VNEDFSRFLLPVSFLLCGCFGLYKVLISPNDPRAYLYLGAAVSLELLLIILWKFREAFFPVLIVVFLLAGMDFPYKSVWLAARWAVLAAGALFAFTIYLKESRKYPFGKFQLLAGCCVLSALISTFGSSDSRLALLKTGSLMLVFLYGITGARMAIVGREAKFFSGLLLACEVLVYISAVVYFVARFPLFGNPNSLGAIMGIVVAPLLMWGVLVSEGKRCYKRRVFALSLCGVLLLSSLARAAMAGAVMAALMFCLPLRRYRLLMQGAGMVLLMGMLIISVRSVRSNQSPNQSRESSLVALLLHKGHSESSILLSREGPWQQTKDAVRKHPWFGTGFGTSETNYEAANPDTDTLRTASVVTTTREHGNSYLAILEWVGLLGVVPFCLLIIMTGVNVARVVLWMYRSQSYVSPAVPIAAVAISALVHAAFEDWMFAPGYYITVFFWAFAFVLVDLIPVAKPRLVQQGICHPIRPSLRTGTAVPAR